MGERMNRRIGGVGESGKHGSADAGKTGANRESGKGGTGEEAYWELNRGNGETEKRGNGETGKRRTGKQGEGTSKNSSVMQPMSDIPGLPSPFHQLPASPFS